MPGKSRRDAPVIVLPLQFLLLLSVGGNGAKIAGAAGRGQSWCSGCSCSILMATTLHPCIFVAFVAAAAAVLKQFNFDLSAKLNVRQF